MTASASVVEAAKAVLSEAENMAMTMRRRAIFNRLKDALTHPARQDARDAMARVIRKMLAEGNSRPLKVRSEEAADAIIALTQAAPDGWVLVPVEPTEAMLSAGYNRHGCGPEEDEIGSIWTAMLSASPAPPAQGAGGGDDPEQHREANSSRTSQRKPHQILREDTTHD